MHYCLMLFTSEFPTKEKIDNMMKNIHGITTILKHMMNTHNLHTIGTK